MTKLKVSSKRGQRFWTKYANAVSRGKRTLTDIYSRCSRNKHVAYNDIRLRMINEGGHDLAIIESNRHCFSTAYILNGNLIVDTRDYTYCVEGGIL